MKGCSSKYRRELRLISSFEQGKQLPSVVTVKKDFLEDWWIYPAIRCMMQRKTMLA